MSEHPIRGVPPYIRAISPHLSPYGTSMCLEFCRTRGNAWRVGCDRGDEDASIV